ncbi:HIT family protein [Streptacidiphilus cavernicola]|uniref:HIT family protein n=1 Tax=Streptacidiphilus cavernicola TaxID=3342716 RepID=A0ABV6VPK2_9ACTN
MDCYACRMNRTIDTLPPRELIAADPHWRVAHAMDTSLPGWLVLLPRRHVTALAELTDQEATGLGSWQVRLSRALTEVTGCAKTYAVQFAEAEGFAHVHVHVVPRMPDLAPALRGPGVFALLNAPTEERVPPQAMDALATRLTAALRSAAPEPEA